MSFERNKICYYANILFILAEYKFSNDSKIGRQLIEILLFNSSEQPENLSKSRKYAIFFYDFWANAFCYLIIQYVIWHYPNET